MKNILVVITGPTAVGKTDAALQLAEQIPAEIINADIGQCYTPLTLGTAKPDWKNQKVAHHLFDIIGEPKNITVVAFRKRLLAAAEEIRKRNKIPIVVGGSAFYIKSLFFPPVSVDTAKPEVAVGENGVPECSKAELGAKNGVPECSEAELGVKEDLQQHDNLWQQLHAIDPVRAANIHPSDTYRLERALSIWKKTGKLPSLFAPQYQPPLPFYCIICLRAREQLYKHIDERVLQMMDQGWVEEVKALMGTTWEPFLKKKKIIGYDVIIDYLNAGTAESKRDEMIARIQAKTRHYAKRQIIFFKGFEKQLKEAIAQKHDEFKLDVAMVENIDLTLLPLDLYIKQLSQLSLFTWK